MSRKVGRISPDVPLSQAAVFEQLREIETIFRLNPHWTIKDFALSSGKRLEQGGKLAVELEDYAKNTKHSFNATCTVCEPDTTMVLEYSGGRKLSTTLFVGGLNGSSRITLEETYEEDESENLEWHQQKLEFWLRSIVAYLMLLSRTGPRASVTKWFMRRFWIPASPSGRSISLLIFKISLIELGLIVAIIIMWALFMQK
jgi:hypothetical protein